ncbi:hypothetical protein ACH9D2_16350 [Kocuria sp. M4R2S49]|uniref:hypothetical protein n=1 Tax=Kocuria rhizosphaericola TaxID=3376284 RepID=UPI0037BA26FB
MELATTACGATIGSGAPCRGTGSNPFLPAHRESTALLVSGELIALIVVAVSFPSRGRHHTPAQRLL